MGEWKCNQEVIMCSIKVVQTSFCTKPKPSFKCTYSVNAVAQRWGWQTAAVLLFSQQWVFSGNNRCYSAESLLFLPLYIVPVPQAKNGHLTGGFQKPLLGCCSYRYLLPLYYCWKKAVEPLLYGKGTLLILIPLFFIYTLFIFIPLLLNFIPSSSLFLFSLFNPLFWRISSR